MVAEGVPHHITQRGNGRQTVFDDAQDHHVYLKLLREYTREYGSSARAHATDHDDGFVQMAAWSEFYTAARWRETLRLGVDDGILRERLRSATRTGRPLGSEYFLDEIERNTRRALRPRQVGRPRKAPQRPQLSLEIGI